MKTCIHILLFNTVTISTVESHFQTSHMSVIKITYFTLKIFLPRGTESWSTNRKQRWTYNHHFTLIHMMIQLISIRWYPIKSFHCANWISVGYNRMKGRQIRVCPLPLLNWWKNVMDFIEGYCFRYRNAIKKRIACDKNNLYLWYYNLL